MSCCVMHEAQYLKHDHDYSTLLYFTLPYFTLASDPKWLGSDQYFGLFAFPIRDSVV